MRMFSLFARKSKAQAQSVPSQPVTEPEVRAFPSPPYLLNLGCGSCYHSAWLNLDFLPQGPEVYQHDLRQPLPFAEESALVVYHSHVLEHFTRSEGAIFLKECYRVLRTGGILRVVVPDLETIARLYLENLSGAAKGDIPARNKHFWMTIELVDQLARERSGGEMLSYWQQNPMPEEDFVLQRLGREVVRFLEYFRSLPPEEQERLRAARTQPQTPLEVGQFRLGGEPHKWMYDRVSLAEALRVAGFKKIRQVNAGESNIPAFSTYGLDLHQDGSVRKPDSLFMEGIKN